MNTRARVICGDGTSEAVWQSWPRLSSLPSRPLADWLPMTSRLVVVAPHPDDEVLMCGGLIQMHAASGGAVHVISVTDGEASHPHSRRWSARLLAAERRNERARGLAHLAPQAECSRLGVPDGQVARHEDFVEAELRRALRREDCIVSTWRLDGHPDHEAAARAAGRARCALQCPMWEAPVWMWHWATLDDSRVPWSRLAGLDLSDAALIRKRCALNEHRTQLEPRDSGDGPVLAAGIVARSARRIEHFFG